MHSTGTLILANQAARFSSGLSGLRRLWHPDTLERSVPLSALTEHGYKHGCRRREGAGTSSAAAYIRTSIHPHLGRLDREFDELQTVGRE